MPPRPPASGTPPGRASALGPRRWSTATSSTSPELQALVARAALFIGGDTGPLHVAATTRIPVVGIYGPTLPIRSAPWRDPTCITESVDIGELPCRPCDQRHCEPGDFRCLTHLRPDAVIAAAERALARAYDQRHDDRRPACGAAAQA